MSVMGIFHQLPTRPKFKAHVGRESADCCTEVTWTGAVRNQYALGMSCRRTATLIVLLILSLVGISAAKPRLRVAADGFPTGQATPEGAASDLARAFMARDAVEFRQICIRPYGGGQPRTEYTQYLNGVADHLKQEEGNPSPDDPFKT
jgi:hypothetical protein